MARDKKKKRIVAFDLGIKIKSRREKEIFKWFLACLLFGKPIQQEIAQRAYFELINSGISSARKIENAGWDKLVKILDEARYVRYDFSTAARLLEVAGKLQKDYGGRVSNIVKSSKNRADLKSKLLEFRGIGPVTTEIFLREIKI